MQNLTIEVYVDIACPWCRLGRARFARATAALGDEVTVTSLLRPYQLNADESTEAVPLREMMTARYGAAGVEKMFAEMRGLGAAEGVEFNLERGLAVNTFTAHRLLWHALHEYGPQVQGALADLLFDAYFRDGLNVNDAGTLRTLAERAGLDGERTAAFLASTEGEPEVRAEIGQARGRGVRAVPTYVFPDGDMLSGAIDSDALAARLRAAHHGAAAGVSGDRS